MLYKDFLARTPILQAMKVRLCEVFKQFDMPRDPPYTPTLLSLETSRSVAKTGHNLFVLQQVNG